MQFLKHLINQLGANRLVQNPIHNPILEYQIKQGLNEEI
jgi:hypothetical protein